jgi:pyruvate/2-oxoglutarate dehydrogenase complex dihydrolipoamide dehydrogenase (E3) component
VRQAITSNEALELQELPKHAIIVGAGYIGTAIALESALYLFRNAHHGGSVI